jgi:hypothetical protein
VKNRDKIKYVEGESILPYAFEWAMGSDYGKIFITAIPKLLRKNIGLNIYSDTSVFAMQEMVFKEWSKSGHIIPGKRCIILEKRKYL